MTAQQLNLDNIAIISPLRTTGFPAASGQFHRPSVSERNSARRASTQQTTVAAGLQIGLGTRTAETEIIQTQGDFATTGNPLDLAIEGLGFFQILCPMDKLVTPVTVRFIPNAQGALVTADGNPLQPAITIPADAVKRDRRQRRHGQRHSARPDCCHRCGRHPDRAIYQSGRLNSAGNNIYCPRLHSGQPVIGTPGGFRGIGNSTAGHAGAVERERRQSVRGYDPGSAVLRIELASK